MTSGDFLLGAACGFVISFVLLTLLMTVSTAARMFWQGRHSDKKIEADKKD